MRRNLFTDNDFQLASDGYLVDNAPWQGEIRRRVEEAARWDAPKFEETVPESAGDHEQEAPPPVEAPMDPKAAYEAAMEKAAREAAEKTERMISEARERVERETNEKRETARLEMERARLDSETKSKEAAEAVRKTAEEEGRSRGFEAGKAEGLDAGRREGRAEWESRIREWDGLMQSALSERKRAVADLEGLLVDLVGDALYRCLQREAQERPQMVVDLVGAALKRAHDKVHLKLHLNPEDVSRVETVKQELQLSVGAGDLQIVPDGRIEKGGCLLETEAGSVDARLGVLSAQAQDALKSSM